MGLRGRIAPRRTVERTATLGLGRITKLGNLFLSRKALIRFAQGK